MIFLLAVMAVVSCDDNEPEPLKPVAEFTSAVEDLTVVFTNSSKNASSYAWDFGDDNTSTGESPTYTFSKAGTYTVKLTATGEGGSGVMTKEVTVEAPEEPEQPLPSAGFAFEAEDLTVTFTNASENASSYAWDFGDDNTSTEESPTHTYAETGTYTVVLTVAGEDGTEVSASKDVTVEAPEVPGRVYFDVANQPELRTLPSFRTPGTASVTVDAEQLAGVTTVGQTTFSYVTVPAGESSPRAFYDYLALNMRASTLRINKITFTTPTIVRGKYKVWVCYRRTAEDGELLVEFNGEPLQNSLPYAELFPVGEEAELLQQGWKRYITPNTGHSQSRLVGTINVETTGTHEISLEVLVDDHQEDVWLDMIQFIPEEEDQLWPKVAEDGTLVYSEE